MRNPITKAIRHVKRDVSRDVTVGVGSVGIGAVALAAATVLTGGAAIAAAPALILGLFPTIAAHDYKRPKKIGNNTLVINGYKLVGDNKALNRINLTQYVIAKKTDELKHLAELPEKLLKAYIEDVQNDLKNVRVYIGSELQPWDSFHFVREYYDAQGKLRLQEIPVCKQVANQGALDEPPSATTRPFQPMPVANTVAPDFSEVAKLEKRVKKIEAELNPPPVVLDKTGSKLSGPKHS